MGWGKIVGAGVGGVGGGMAGGAYDDMIRERELQAEKERIARERPADLQWSAAAGQDPNSILGAGLMSNVQLDNRAYDKFSAEALRSGPSAWRGLMDKQMAQQQAVAQDNLAQQQMGQRASAMNSLAMRGGLRGGSAERMATANQAQGLLARQGLARQGMANAANFDIQDENNRRQDLQTTMGADLQRGQFGAQQQQFNIGNSLREMQSKRDFEANQYNQKMQAWAAKSTAAAAPQDDGGK